MAATTRIRRTWSDVQRQDTFHTGEEIAVLRGDDEYRGVFQGMITWEGKLHAVVQTDEDEWQWIPIGEPVLIKMLRPSEEIGEFEPIDGLRRLVADVEASARPRDLLRPIFWGVVAVWFVAVPAGVAWFLFWR